MSTFSNKEFVGIPASPRAFSTLPLCFLRSVLISLHLCLAVYNKCLEIIEVCPAMSINSVYLGSLRLLW